MGDKTNNQKDIQEENGTFDELKERLKALEESTKNSNQVAKSEGSIIKKWIIIVAFLALACFCVVTLVKYNRLLENTMETNDVAEEEMTVYDIKLDDLGELATQQAIISVVRNDNDPRVVFGIDIPGTKYHWIYSYNFTVKAGFKFEDIVPTVDETNKTITIKMPEVEILSSNIDLNSKEVYLDEDNIFNRYSLNESTEAMKEMEEEAKEKAISYGIYDEAKTNAETLITKFLANEYSESEYKYEFVYEEATTNE